MYTFRIETDLKKYDEFTTTQMEEIGEGFLNGLSEKIVQLYAKPEFDACQMQEIRESIEEGLELEDVKTYINPNYSSGMMSIMREELEKKSEVYQKIENRYKDELIKILTEE